MLRSAIVEDLDAFDGLHTAEGNDGDGDEGAGEGDDGGNDEERPLGGDGHEVFLEEELDCRRRGAGAGRRGRRGRVPSGSGCGPEPCARAETV